VSHEWKSTQGPAVKAVLVRHSAFCVPPCCKEQDTYMF